MSNVLGYENGIPSLYIDTTLPSPGTIFRIFKTTSINKVYEEVEKYKKNLK